MRAGMGARAVVRDLIGRVWAFRHGRAMGQGSMGQYMLAGTELCEGSEGHVESIPEIEGQVPCMGCGCEWLRI